MQPSLTNRGRAWLRRLMRRISIDYKTHPDKQWRAACLWANLDAEALHNTTAGLPA